ncbi:MAG: PAS domain-containing hybrid sensor histidine kinase/response regulator [Solirubrobacteraceae bacterium]
MTGPVAAPPDRDRRLALIVAGSLFVGIFLLRVLVEDLGAVTLLYALPIVLVAVEWGRTGGLVAAALALGLFAVWDVGWNEADLDGFGYVNRGTAFFVLGGVTGALADRLRRVSAESARFWELSSDLLCTAGFDGYFKRLNPAWQRILGWTPEELRSRPLMEFIHPDDRERVQAEGARMGSEGFHTLAVESRYRCKGGGYRTVLWAATNVPDEELVYATGRDVSDSKRQEEELRGTAQFLDSVLENLPNMVFVKDAEELRFVRLNRAGEELLGVPRTELLGRGDHDMFPADEADNFVRADREVLTSGGIKDIPDEPVNTVHNGVRILHTRKIAIRDEDGVPRYLLGISEDVTDRRAAEQAAEVAWAEADRANQAKSEFLSRMSHELRTPLNAVIGFGQLLELDGLDPPQSESVEQILKAARHLLELINEVLDISRIEAGTMSMSLEPVHLGSVVADALSLIRPMADEANVRLLGCPGEYADVHVVADQQRLKQVLINLLSNAVKYNRARGEVCVQCTMLDGGWVEVAVADTGRGMSHEQLERLFKPFDRLGAERTGIEGTGLGLSLCKGLMEAMGGTVTADSEQGRGSTLRVQLRCADRPDAMAAPHDHVHALIEGPRAGGLTIVYIEDNLSNVKLVERLLARFTDVRLIPAMQGELGIDLVRQHSPDLILLDLHLPDLHGREVLDRLKQDPDTAAIPVIVLSADATTAQFERLCAAGAAGYLTKPIDVRSLFDTVWNSVAAGER